jgi:hypothetical protein
MVRQRFLFLRCASVIIDIKQYKDNVFAKHKVVGSSMYLGVLIY